jgi:hypothetical protein
MADFINNPRRAPRTVIGCDARVALKSGSFFQGPTVDYGPAGCQLVAPTPLAPDERVFVELRTRGVPESSLLSGRVAWTAGEAPFRTGVQFDPGSHDEAAWFYGRLAAAHPELVEVDEVPDRVALDSRVVPWKREGDAAVLPGEEEVLLAVGTGIRIRELREKLGARWDAAINPLFALLARRLLILEDGSPSDGAP